MGRRSSRGNPNHYPAGHPRAGQFAPSGTDYAVSYDLSKEEAQARSEAVERGQYDNEQAKRVREMGKRFFNGRGEHNRDGEWEVGNGGYDLEYEVSHNRTPVFGCVDGEIEVYNEEYRQYANEFAKVSGNKVKPPARTQEDDENELVRAYLHGAKTGDYEEYEKISNSFTEKYGIDEYRKANNKAIDAGIEDEEVGRISKAEDEAIVKTEYGGEVDEENRRLAEEAWERGDQALGKKKSEYGSKEEYIAAKMKYYDQLDEEEVYAAVHDAELGKMPFYEDDKRTAIKHKAMRELYGDNETQAKARAEETFTYVNGKGETVECTNAVKHFDGYGNVYFQAESKKDGFGLYLQPEEYDSRKTVMPWDTDPKYKGNKNARLMWLYDHPEHKYNDQELIMGIKRIQHAADRGVSKEQRQKETKKLMDRFQLSATEAKELIGEEFLR